MVLPVGWGWEEVVTDRSTQGIGGGEHGPSVCQRELLAVDIEPRKHTGLGTELGACLRFSLPCLHALSKIKKKKIRESLKQT